MRRVFLYLLCAIEASRGGALHQQIALDSFLLIRIQFFA